MEAIRDYALDPPGRLMSFFALDATIIDLARIRTHSW